MCGDGVAVPAPPAGSPLKSSRPLCRLRGAMPDLRRQELRVPGLNEPISHEVSAVAIPGMTVAIEAVVGLPA